MTDRELDALVAEKVKGWTDIYLDPWDNGKKSCGIPPRMRPQEAHPKPIIPHYSSTGNGMLAVIEAMREKGYGCFSLDTGSVSMGPEFGTTNEAKFSTSWMAAFERGDGQGALETAETAPRAVCLAALKALGVEVDK